MKRETNKKRWLFFIVVILLLIALLSFVSLKFIGYAVFSKLPKFFGLDQTAKDTNFSNFLREAKLFKGIPFKELPSDQLLALSTICSRGFISYVCGVDGKTYQNKCHADFFNVSVAYNGSCTQSKEFAKHLFRLPNINNLLGENDARFAEAPSPYFLYETINYKVWVSPAVYKNLSGYIEAVYLVTYNDIPETNSNLFPRGNIAISPLTENLRVLVGIYDFNTTGFSQNDIQNWTLDALNKYKTYFNNIRANNSLPYMNITWNLVLINPNMSAAQFDEIINQIPIGTNIIINETLIAANITHSDLDLIIIGALDPNLSGGWYLPGELIYAPINLNGIVYSINQSEAIKSIDRFYGSFIGVITHELLHFFGGDSQHRTFYGDAIHPDEKVIKNQGGYRNVSNANLCDFFYTSDFEYLINYSKPELRVVVGQEPVGFFRVVGNNGDCLALPDSTPSINIYNFIGKDINNDGIYELVSVFQPLNNLVLAQIGWSDVDGDGISEIIDPTPYGNVSIKQINQTNKDILINSLQNNQKMRGTISRVINTYKIGPCTFSKMEVRNVFGANSNTILSVPIKCQKYNELINDIYIGKMMYGFLLINDSEYGNIAIPVIPDPYNFP
jgi:hypothetical protein